MVDFGGKLGSKSNQKSIQKGIGKSDENKKVTKMAKKSLQDPATRFGTSRPGSGKGVGGRVNPSPEGRREGYRNSLAS